MKYVVIHIPKTAGTSLQQVLCGLFGQTKVTDRFDARPLEPVRAARMEQYDVVLGHISWADVQRYFPDRQTITFLRDPIERCLSWYDFVRGQDRPDGIDTSPDAFENNADQAKALSHELNIVDFFTCGHPHVLQNLGNRMVHQLAGECFWDRRAADDDTTLEQACANLDATTFVGHFERLHDDIGRLHTMFDASTTVDVPHLNRTAKRNRREDLDASVIEAIESINRLDLRLHAHALRSAAAGSA